MKCSPLTTGLLVWLSACRFGGPTGGALELEESFDDALVGDGGTEDGGDVVSPSSPEAPAPLQPQETPPVEAGVGGQCGQASVPGCNPVHGTSCTPGLSQCIVDHASPTPAGRCVFPSQPLDVGCDENELFTTCPPLFACLTGECRKYCYCAADCDAGDSCSEPAGQGSAALFKVCTQP